MCVCVCILICTCKCNLYPFVHSMVFYSGVQVTVQVLAFGSFGYIPVNGITGSASNSVWLAEEPANSFLRCCTILPSRSSTQGFQLLHLLANSCHFQFFCLIAIVMDVWSDSSLWFWFASLITSVVEYFFMCLVDIYVPYLEKVYSSLWLL